MMSEPVDRELRRQQLSSLMDGELADAAALCRDWRDDAELRVTWHAYHLIGDVMRSEDLAQPFGRDEAFLQALRRRLADEPVVMAPAATVAAAQPAPRRRGWIAPLAVAAGFAAVAGVMVVTQLAAPGGDRPAAVIAAQPAPAGGAVRVSTAQPVPPAGAEGTLVRDARLDRYLEAHRQYGPSAALVPGGVVRSTATAAPQR